LVSIFSAVRGWEVVCRTVLKYLHNKYRLEKYLESRSLGAQQTREMSKLGDGVEETELGGFGGDGGLTCFDNEGFHHW
jgi:hypothetical protein